MIYPIHLYGLPVLRAVAGTISSDYPNLPKLIDDMFETLTASGGVGLAAPQIGLPIRVLVVDLTDAGDDFPEEQKVKFAMINSSIVEEVGQNVTEEEGCLSFPGIHEKVTRKETIRVKYCNEKLEEKEETFTGFVARVIQHESDHLDGKVFIDRISPIRKQLIKGRLKDILKGNASCDYRTKRA